MLSHVIFILLHVTFNIYDVTCFIAVWHAIFMILHAILMILDVTPVPYHHLPDVLLDMVDATQTGERTLIVIEPLKQGLEHITKMFSCKP